MPLPPTRHSTPSKNHTTVLLLALPALCSCAGIQSALDPRGPQAASVATISWIMFWGSAAILLLVMALALYAVYRRPDARAPFSARALIIAGGLVLPVAVLSALLVYGTYAMGGIRLQDAAQQAQIEVTGNRWWWQVRYRAADGHVIASANEIRIPAGTPVKLLLRSNDVIHSFWVPNLTGKMDLIPGRTNHVTLHADAPGVFRGQCAEYCGAQHAHMAFHVIAQPPDEHAAWLQRQRADAAAPADAALARGRALFIEHCLACHTVRGVGSARERGPDLTHVGSRRFLGAGMLENTRENLVAFTAHAQRFKPGSGMPSHPNLAPESLQSLAAYLESLQ